MKDIQLQLNAHYLEVVEKTLEGYAAPRLRRKIIDLARSVRQRMDFYPASCRWHHVWPGGLGDHTGQVITIAAAQNEALCLKLDRANIVLAGLMHDWNKLTRYTLIERPDAGNLRDMVIPAFRYNTHRLSTAQMMATIGRTLKAKDIRMPAELVNAIEMSEGGWSDTARTHKDCEMSALACLIHNADLMSAKVFRNMGHHSIALREWNDLVKREMKIAKSDPEEKYL